MPDRLLLGRRGRCGVFGVSLLRLSLIRLSLIRLSLLRVSLFSVSRIRLSLRAWRRAGRIGCLDLDVRVAEGAEDAAGAAGDEVSEEDDDQQHQRQQDELDEEEPAIGRLASAGNTGHENVSCEGVKRCWRGAQSRPGSGDNIVDALVYLGGLVAGGGADVLEVHLQA